MMPASALAEELDLLGKRIVYVMDPYSHGDGLVPRSALIAEVVVAEPDYVAMRRIGDLDGMTRPLGYMPIMRVWFDLELLEPGDRLEEYLPGASETFGAVDYVYFQGEQREKWNREHRA